MSVLNSTLNNLPGRSDGWIVPGDPASMALALTEPVPSLTLDIAGRLSVPGVLDEDASTDSRQVWQWRLTAAQVATALGTPPDTVMLPWRATTGTGDDLASVAAGELRVVDKWTGGHQQMFGSLLVLIGPPGPDASAAVAAAVAARDVAVTSAAAAQGSAQAAEAAISGLVTRLRHTGVAWYEAGALAPDTYQALDARGIEVAALSGNTGYARQGLGVPVDPQAQSRMRRCVLHNDGSRVVYYLDADDSTKIAGLWDGATQRGWVRVHEGTFDPVKPIPGQATTGSPGLRSGVPAYDATATYGRGDRVLHGGMLWDCLADAQLGVAPAAGTAAADLTGAAGQVMVEIPRFYYRWTRTAEIFRHEMEIVFDTAEYRTFPDLTVDSGQPAAKVVNGRLFDAHPAFTKAGVQRPARYLAAFGTSATDTGNNAAGVLRSIADGATVNTTNVALTNYTAKARNRNTGLSDPSGHANNVWQVADNWLWNAVQLLLITEYRTLHSQGVLGGGNIAGADYNKIAGRTAPAGNASGPTSAAGALVAVSAAGDTDGLVWRGIEDPWGTAWRRTAGGVIRNTPGGKEVYWSNSPKDFADTSHATTSYQLVASGIHVPAADGWLYPTAIAAGVPIATAVGGSVSTYVPDGNYLRSSTASDINILMWGAVADYGSGAGLLALRGLSTAGGAGVGDGAALAR